MKTHPQCNTYTNNHSSGCTRMNTNHVLTLSQLSSRI